MKFVKYTIYLPISENETKEVIFYTLDEVSSFLDINTTMVYRIMNGTCKFSSKSNIHLKGIKITRENVDEKIKERLKQKILPKKEKIEDKNDIVFQTELLKKYNEKISKGEILTKE